MSVSANTALFSSTSELHYEREAGRPKFPADAPLDKVLRAFSRLGFVLLRRGNHLALSCEEADGTRTTLTLPNHRSIKAPTLRSVLTQSGISREDFLRAYEQT